MRRVVVAGGTGFFGAAAAERLRAVGIEPVIASRRGHGGVRLDVEDAASLRRVLRAGDVVLDAAGPFQGRTTALVEAACEVGFDVVDLADALGYVEAVHALGERVDAAGVRVLPACSSASAVSAAAVALSGVPEPVRVTAWLVPAARHTAVGATATSLLRSLGQPIRVLAGGRLETRAGWMEARRFGGAGPLGGVRGRLFETADAITLPRSFPSLRSVAWYVHPNVAGLSPMLSLAARVEGVRRAMERLLPLALPLARRLGGASGGLAYEVEDAQGTVRHVTLHGGQSAYLAAVLPAVLAVRAMVEGRFEPTGIVPPHRHLCVRELVGALEETGIHILAEA